MSTKGRIRSIKPEVHLDAELWDLEQKTGYPMFRLFTGVWNYSDREGRFEWDTRFLKVVILPWWNGDFEAAMNALAEAGFITRYQVDGEAYGCVPKFLKHQRPNPKEEQSTIPPPPSRVPIKIFTRENPDEPRVEIQNVSSGKEGKGKEGNARERAEGPPIALAGRKEPQRLLPELERLVREEFHRLKKPTQGATADQRLAACRRADEAATLGLFESPLAALEALARVAVAEALRPNGKLGFALAQAEFCGPPVPANTNVRPISDVTRAALALERDPYA